MTVPRKKFQLILLPLLAMSAMLPAFVSRVGIRSPIKLRQLVSLFLVLAFRAAGAAPALAAEPAGVRVGIVAFQDSREDLERYERIFSDLARDGRMRFRIAAGTYGDVRYWLDRGMVDVAVLSPGVFAQAASDCEYLASAGSRSASGTYRYQYHAASVVDADSPFRNMDDIRRAAEQDRARFLFVDALSVSGRIAPGYALLQAGIQPRPARVQYTYSHSNSLRSLAENGEKVAFVLEDALTGRAGARPFRRIDFPALDRLAIPTDAVVARRGFAPAARISELLAEHRDARGAHDFKRFTDWERRYGVVREWQKALQLPAESNEAQTVNLQEIGYLLRHYERSQPKPPRLAVVLSGGGAKCSYQVGAVAALEEELARLRAADPGCKLDIGLVVGTSGGAMNALPVALGITATPEGREDFRRVWTELDQREIVRPSGWLRSNIGLWWACFHASWVLWLVRRRFVRPEKRGAWAAAFFILLAVAALVLEHWRWPPWRFLGENHGLQHLWLLVSLGFRWLAGFLLAAGAITGAVQWAQRRRGGRLELGSPRLRYLLLLALVALPLTQLLVALFHEETLSDGSGIEAVLARKYPAMINAGRSREGVPALQASVEEDAAAQLQSLSREIIRGPLRRDLVLTASCLSQSQASLPDDLYFYSFASAGPAARYGRRGVSLQGYPSILLDVVMGSGSIYPIFPSRVIRDFPQAGARVELVDGGFSHNSPIEAAVLWGATHVVLLQASPEERSRRGNFLKNSAEAFNHLYNQAQLLDAHSKERVAIFTLAPSAPHLCVIDFADNLIGPAIAKGHREAVGETRDGAGEAVSQPQFLKQLGEPLFQLQKGIGPGDGDI